MCDVCVCVAGVQRLPYAARSIAHLPAAQCPWGPRRWIGDTPVVLRGPGRQTWPPSDVPHCRSPPDYHACRRPAGTISRHRRNTARTLPAAAQLTQLSWGCSCFSVILQSAPIKSVNKTNLRSLDFPINRWRLSRNANRYSTSDYLVW